MENLVKGRVEWRSELLSSWNEQNPETLQGTVGAEKKDESESTNKRFDLEVTEKYSDTGNHIN